MNFHQNILFQSQKWLVFGRVGGEEGCIHFKVFEGKFFEVQSSLVISDKQDTPKTCIILSHGEILKALEQMMVISELLLKHQEGVSRYETYYSHFRTV